MRLKKLIGIMVVFVLVMTLSLALVACVKKDPLPPVPGPDPGPNPGGDENEIVLSYTEVFDKIGNALGTPDSCVGTISNVIITVPKTNANGEVVDDVHTLSLGSNHVYNVDGAEFSLRVFAGVQEAGKEDLSALEFAVYISNGNLFMDVAGAKINLSDIPVEYVIDIAEKILQNMPSLKVKIDELISGLISGMSLDGIVDLLMMIISPTTTNQEVDGKQLVGVNISLQPLLAMVPTVLGMLNFNQIFAGMGIALPDSGESVDGLITDIIGLIPMFSIDINAIIDPNGKLEKLDIAMLNEEENTTIINSSSTITYSDKRVDIGIPDTFIAYEEFSLTNFSFDIDLGAELDNLDVGALISMLAGGNSPIKPGIIIIDVKDINIKLKVNLDLDFHDNYKNLVAVELFRATKDGRTIGDPLLGLYYVNGIFKINISQDGATNALKIPNLILEGVDITRVFTDLFANVDVIIQGLIKDLFGSSTPDEAANPYEALSDKVSYYNSTATSEDSALGMLASDIIPVAIDEEGDGSVDHVLSGIIATALKIFGFDNSNGGKPLISTITNEDRTIIGLNISIGKEFFDALESLVPGKIVIPEALKHLAADIDINWASGSFDSVDITANLTEAVEIKISANNFKIGFKNHELRSYIIEATNDKEYVSSLTSIITGALDGINIRTYLDIELHKGKMDLSGMLRKMGLNIPDIPIELNNNYLLNTELLLKMKYNEASPKSSKFMLEVNLLNDNFPYADKGTLFGIYLEEGVVYIDLSGIKIANLRLPKLKFELDIMSLLADELAKLNINDILDKVVDMINPPKPVVKGSATSYNSQRSNVSYTNNHSNFDNSSENIFIGINKDLIQLHASGLALTNLLKGFGLNIELPKLDLKIDASGTQNINMTLDIFNDAGKKRIGLHGGITKLVIGEVFDDSEFKEINPDDYTNDIIDAVKKIAYHGDIAFNIDLKSDDSLFDLSQIINNVLAASGSRFNIPLKLDVNNLDEKFTVAVKWNINDLQPKRSELLLEIYSSEMDFTAAPADRIGLFIGVYYKEQTLYVDLSQLGLMKFRIEGINIPKLIDDAISNILTGIGSSFDSNLTNIINNLLGGIIKPSANASTNLFANATNQAIVTNALNGVGTDVTSGTVKADPMGDIINVLLSQLLISDNQIFVNLFKQILADGTIVDPLKEILATAGIDAGASLGIEMMLDWFNGAVSVDVGIDDFKLGVGLKINSIGSAIPIDWTQRETANFFKSEDYADWTKSAAGIGNDVTILDTMLMLFNTSSVTDNTTYSNGVKPILDIDLRMLNGLNQMHPNNQYTYASISKATRDLTAADQATISPLPMQPLTGDYIVKLYKVTTGGGKTPVAHLVISIKRNQIRLLGDKGLFTAVFPDLINGSLLNIPIAFNLKDMLSGIGFLNTVLPGMNSSDDTIQAEKVSAETGDQSEMSRLAAPAPKAGLDFTTLFNNIILKFNNDSSINAHLDIKGTALSKMIDDMLTVFLKKVVIGGVTYSVDYKPGQYLGNIWDTNNFIWQMWTNLVRPLIRTFIPSGLQGLVSNSLLDNEAYTDIYELLSRFLPVPQFEQLKVDAHIVNGAMHSVMIESFSNTGYQKIEAMITNGSQKGVVNWMGLPNAISYDPYDGEDLIDTLDNCRPHAPTMAPLTMRNNKTPVKYSGDYSKLKKMNGQYVSGEYSVIATAFPGTPYEETRTIPVIIKDDGGGIVKIEDVIIPAMMGVPNEVVALLADGTTRIIKNVSIVNGEKYRAVPDPISDPKNPVLVINDASVIINGLIKNNVKIKYLPDGVDFAGIIETNAYSMSSFKQKLPASIFFKVKESVYNEITIGNYYRSMIVDDWDTSEYDKLVQDFINQSKDPKFDKNSHPLIKGTKVKITATVNHNKHNEKLVVHELWIRSSITDDIMLDDNYKNTVNIDPYQQMYHTVSNMLPVTDITTPRVSSPYPSSSKVSYSEVLNGQTIYRQDLQNIAWTLSNNIRYTVNGGLYSGSTVSNKTTLNSGDYVWTQDIAVNVLSRVPKALVFGVDNIGRYITSPVVNPYDISKTDYSKYFPTYMDVQFSGLDVAKAKITWDLKELFDMISPQGGKVMVKATVAPSYLDAMGNELLNDTIIKSFEKEIFVPVVVSNITLNSIVTEDSSYTVNNIANHFYIANTSFESLLPKTLRFNSTSKTVVVLPVIYDLNGFVPSLNGGKHTIKARVLIGDTYVEFDYHITTPDRLDPTLNVTNTINVNYYDYLMKGDMAMDSQIKVMFGTDSEILPVTWNISNMNFVNNTGYAVMRIGVRNISILYKDIVVNINVVSAPMVEFDKVPISVSNGFDSVSFLKSEFGLAVSSQTIPYIFEKHTSWKFNYMTENGYDIESTNISWDTSMTSNINMFAYVRIHTDKGIDPSDHTKNVLAVFKIKIILN